MFATNNNESSGGQYSSFTTWSCDGPGARQAAQIALTLLMLLLVTGSVRAEGITSQRVASDLSRPLFATAPPGDTDRLFLIEQHTGRIKILDLTTGVIAATPFLEIDGLRMGNEQGLLGLAFHPDYATNGLFFVNLTASEGGTTHIRRYQVSTDPDTADPGTAMTILTYNQPQSSHNGGWIGFGPNDGLLYISSGDGGGGNDNSTGHTAGIGNGQDITGNLLGKILRIDVNGDEFPGDSSRNYAIPPTNPFVGTTGDDEIWAYGLRNPWRSSFDQFTGDFYIADVGQNNREEVNFQPAASPGGENYGWRLREGTIATPTGGVGGPAPPGAVDPVHDYGHVGAPNGGFSITGGYVYRGPVESIQGVYFFADFITSQVWSFRFGGGQLAEFTNRTAQLAPDVGSMNSIASFGEDAIGNLYVIDLGGDVFKLVADTDDDGVGDDQDNCTLVSNPGQLDTDGDGYGNLCDGDLNNDGSTNTLDLNLYKQAHRTSVGDANYNADADFNGDGQINTLDLNVYKELHRMPPGPSCCAP
jgi:glucose/arabinose dehydrogenase